MYNKTIVSINHISFGSLSREAYEATPTCPDIKVSRRTYLNRVTFFVAGYAAVASNGSTRRHLAVQVVAVGQWGGDAINRIVAFEAL